MKQQQNQIIAYMGSNNLGFCVNDNQQPQIIQVKEINKTNTLNQNQMVTQKTETIPSTQDLQPKYTLKQITSNQEKIETQLKWKDYIFVYNSSNKQKNILQGFVKVYYKKRNNIIFEGLYINSKRFGYGISYGDNKQILYEGYYRNDLEDGWGNKKNGNQSYEGQFRNGLYDGYGNYKSPKEIYEGYFKEGRYDGFGIRFVAKTIKAQKYNNLKQFFIQLLDKSMVDLKALDIKEIYIGEWKDGIKNGHGKVWYEDGSWYMGQFSHGLYHGNGALLNYQIGKSTPVIKGTFKNGNLAKK